MKLTNKEIITILKGLTELEELDLPLNIKTNYTLARNRQILGEIGDIINQKQIEIYKNYGTRTGRDEYTVPDEKIEQVSQELSDLLSVENDNVNLFMIKLEAFGDNNIPFGVIEKLLPIIEE